MPSTLRRLASEKKNKNNRKQISMTITLPRRSGRNNIIILKKRFKRLVLSNQTGQRLYKLVSVIILPSLNSFDTKIVNATGQFLTKLTPT